MRFQMATSGSTHAVAGGLGAQQAHFWSGLVALVGGGQLRKLCSFMRFQKAALGSSLGLALARGVGAQEAQPLDGVCVLAVGSCTSSKIGPT